MARVADIVVLEEVDIEVTDEEVLEYAEMVGIDMELERDLLWLAREGLLAKLPDGWRACKDRNGPGDVFFFHSASGKSTWHHPMDAVYKQKVKEARDERRCVVVTLTLSSSDDGLTLLATNLAGKDLANLSVSESERFSDVERKLREEIVTEHGAILCFAKGAEILGYSSGAKTVGQIFPQAS